MLSFVVSNSETARAQVKAGQVVWIRTRADRKFQEELLNKLTRTEKSFVFTKNEKFYIENADQKVTENFGLVVPALVLSLARMTSVQDFVRWRLSESMITSDQAFGECAEFLKKLGLSKYIDSAWSDLSIETRHYFYICTEIFCKNLVLVFLGEAKFSTRQVTQRWIEMIQKASSLRGIYAAVFVDKLFGINPQPEIWLSAPKGLLAEALADDVDANVLMEDG